VGGTHGARLVEAELLQGRRQRRVVRLRCRRHLARRPRARGGERWIEGRKIPRKQTRGTAEKAYAGLGGRRASPDSGGVLGRMRDRGREAN